MNEYWDFHLFCSLFNLPWICLFIFYIDSVSFLFSCSYSWLAVLAGPKTGFEYYHFNRISFTDRYKSDCCWKWFAGSLAAFSAGYALTGLFSYSLDYAYTRLAADIQASTKCGSHHSSLGFIRCSFTLDSAQTYLVCSDIRPAERCGEWQFNGLIDVYKKTLKSDGVAGLYHGFSISCVGYTVHTALYTLMVDPLIRPLLRDGKVQVGQNFWTRITI